MYMFETIKIYDLHLINELHIKFGKYLFDILIQKD